MTPEEATRAASQAKEITRLAALPPLDYDRERESVAKQLGVRIGTLDLEVRAARRAANHAGEAKQGAALSVPDRPLAADPQDGAAVLADIEALLRQHVVLSAPAACVVAIWILHTYLIDLCTHSPRLAIQSAEKGSGKTTLLELVAPDGQC